MDLESAMLSFLVHTAAGAASVLLLIFLSGLTIPRRSAVTASRRPQR